MTARDQLSLEEIREHRRRLLETDPDEFFKTFDHTPESFADLNYFRETDPDLFLGELIFARAKATLRRALPDLLRYLKKEEGWEEKLSGSLVPAFRLLQQHIPNQSLTGLAAYYSGSALHRAQMLVCPMLRALLLGRDLTEYEKFEAGMIPPTFPVFQRKETEGVDLPVRVAPPKETYSLFTNWLLSGESEEVAYQAALLWIAAHGGGKHTGFKRDGDLYHLDDDYHRTRTRLRDLRTQGYTVEKIVQILTEEQLSTSERKVKYILQEDRERPPPTYEVSGLGTRPIQGERE